MKPLKAILLFGLIVFLSGSSNGQTFERQPYAIPFRAGADSIEHPLIGGLYNPIHQFIDIDGDGDKDLVLLDNNDLSVLFFRNSGTQLSPAFSNQPADFLPALRGWFRFADIDGDGRLDLLTAGDSLNTAAVYKNTGTISVPQFSPLTMTLRDSAGSFVYVQEQCIPALVDIDADGDLDLFSLNPGIGTINYYQNSGSTSNFRLSFRTAFYQNIQICPGCSRPEENLHGQGTMYFADVDADGDFDMFYGDLFDNGVFFFRNIGTPQVALLDSVSGHFPPVNPVITNGFNQPTLADIDGDGDLDLFVSVLPPFQQRDNFYYYENTGTAQQFDFNLITRNFLSILDFGIQSAPGFADIDGDGDEDAMVGTLNGRVALLRNTGSPVSPRFVLEDSAFISSVSNFSFVPLFTDIDADGDQDLFLGQFSGSVQFYRNTGSPSVPQFQRQTSFFDSINVGFNAAPAFFDIDGDGDLDFFVGKGDGRISYYRNVGSPQSGSFVLQTTSFLGIQFGSNAKPVFSDVDGDGDKDLIVGTSDGKLAFYRNTGPYGNPTFVFVTDTFGGIGKQQEVAPAFVDIDGDGDQDVFIGNVRGGLEFFRNTTPLSVEEPLLVPHADRLFQNFPNPFNPETTIRFSIAAGRGSVPVTLEVYSVLGERVQILTRDVYSSGTHSVVWNASSKSSGVYICMLRTPTSTSVIKLLVMK